MRRPQPSGAFGAIDCLDLAALPIALDSAAQTHDQRHDAVKALKFFAAFDEWARLGVLSRE